MAEWGRGGGSGGGLVVVTGVGAIGVGHGGGVCGAGHTVVVALPDGLRAAVARVVVCVGAGCVRECEAGVHVAVNGWAGSRGGTEATDVLGVEGGGKDVGRGSVGGGCGGGGGEGVICGGVPAIQTCPGRWKGLPFS